MNLRTLTLISVLLMSCAPKEDRKDLARRAVGPVTQNGWARLPLDGPAQRAFPDVWLSDGKGVSIPFEVEREGLWQPRRLELQRVLMGRNPQDQPTVEFSLKFPEGWQVRDREHLKVELEMTGEAPWVARLEVARRLEGSPYLKLERDSPFHVFDLGSAGKLCTFYLPWDARDYRITLIPTQGAAPKLKGVSVTASTQPEALQSDQVLIPAATPKKQDEREIWTLKLDEPERIVGADLLMKPPLAPIQPFFQVPIPSGSESMESVYASGLVWNLPALNSHATRIALGPVITDELECSLPSGANLDSIKLLVRRDVLIFPAESGHTYFLHVGGRMKRAPGNLLALPDSSRSVYAREPLKLGPPEPDPEGLPKVVGVPEQTRPWLPWLAGGIVILLGFFGWKLLKTED